MKQYNKECKRTLFFLTHNDRIYVRTGKGLMFNRVYFYFTGTENQDIFCIYSQTIMYLTKCNSFDYLPSLLKPGHKKISTCCGDGDSSRVARDQISRGWYAEDLQQVSIHVHRLFVELFIVRFHEVEYLGVG